MGDRAWFQIEFAEKDQQKFADLDDEFNKDNFDEVDINSGILSGTFYEMNYGGYSQIDKFAEAKLTFRANHGAGGNYPAGEAVCFNGWLRELVSDDHGSVMVPITKEGVSQRYLDHAREFFEINDKIDEYFKNANIQNNSHSNLKKTA